MYSLSSCWNSHRHTDGREMLREIREMGFEYAELSHGIRISLMPGILDAVDAGEIRISSLHNFCPLPLGITRAAPNIYQFSSPRDRERELARKHTMKTLEFAERVGAKMVVLHMGSIGIRDYTHRLLEMVEKGQHETEKYRDICQQADLERESKKLPFVERAYQFLKRLIPEAESRGLRLGIENREALEEIPIDSDFPSLFAEFKSPTIAYWHDCGHAQIKENLGFISHLLQIESLANDLGGMHIHDVEFPGRDHCPPGDGGIDFAALKPYVKPETLKVFELSPRLSPDQVKRGVEYLYSVWGAE